MRKKRGFGTFGGIYLRNQGLDRLPRGGWSCGDPRFPAKMRKRIYKTLGVAKSTWIHVKLDTIGQISILGGYWDLFSLNLTGEYDGSK